MQKCEGIGGKNPPSSLPSSLLPVPSDQANAQKQKEFQKKTKKSSNNFGPFVEPRSLAIYFLGRCLMNNFPASFTLTCPGCEEKCGSLSPTVACLLAARCLSGHFSFECLRPASYTFACFSEPRSFAIAYTCLGRYLLIATAFRCPSP